MKNIPQIQEFHNILVCRAEGSLSEAIISSCCYREIKKASPHTKITVACFGPAYEFYKRNPYVDEVFKLPVRSLIRYNQRWLGLFLAALKLRRRHFDLVLDPSDKKYLNWRMFKYIVGGDKVLDVFTSPVQPFGAPDKHGSENEASVLKLLGIPTPDKAYDLPILSSARKSAGDWLEGRQLQNYILFNPWGEEGKPLFKPNVVKEISKAMARLNLAFVVAVPQNSAEAWAEQMKDEPAVFVKPTEDIFELFELVRRSSLTLTPACAVVHIAAGFGKPSLVFASLPLASYAPDNPKAKILEVEAQDVNVFDWWKLESAIEQLKKEL